MSDAPPPDPPPPDPPPSRPGPNDAARNVRGGTLEPCSFDPLTGYYRSGDCRTGPDDRGVHVVCAQVTREFLEFSAARGNDLITPRPEYGFEGLSPGDRWCLCADRWREAYDAGCAPPVVLAATHERALERIERSALDAHALDAAS